ncbi:hypothetical protein NQ314_006472 [Rhamnusium bicolor]|uniref:Uncharacterized protein n=1 Tax=Rhamnusium bicolor TaxID=1586634 RepID=A0AAV8Z170_9CUCU|nr:hypothetical protein NQ314_006472 [Rhamnusium bicolor]
MRQLAHIDLQTDIDHFDNNYCPDLCQCSEVLPSTTRSLIRASSSRWSPKNGVTTSPTNVAILDWQMCYLRSPVFDISYLFYATSSRLELEKFDELLKFYYNSFSNFLKELGSNAEEIFPYSSLKEHWRKYSLFGLIIVIMAFPMVLCDKEEVISFENLQEDQKFSDMLKFDIKEKDLYYRRLKDVAIIVSIFIPSSDLSLYFDIKGVSNLVNVRVLQTMFDDVAFSRDIDLNTHLALQWNFYR